MFAVVEKEYTLTPSRTSAKGNYKSMKLSLEVANREEMLGIFEALKKSDGIKFVM